MKEEEKARAEQKMKLVKFIQKIPVFSTLLPYKAKLILSLCSKIVLQEGNILCKQGDSSDSMFILLQGKLAVKIKNSVTIATIYPVSSIGEMGVFTGEPRTATVEAMEKSSLFCLQKSDLDKLIEKDHQFAVKIMRKVIEVLSERITEDNVKIREFQNYIISQEEASKSQSND